jgi:energy-coupling factor transport system substrate-specific component
VAARPSALSTRVLLICAAIGVATGLLGGIAGWITPIVIATAPMLYGLVLGVHVLPGIIAQEVVRLPWVALLAHVLAALVASATSPQWAGRYIGTALLIGGIQEVVVALIVDLGSFAPWVQAAYLTISVLGPVAWTAVGLAVGARLRSAGVAARR